MDKVNIINAQLGRFSNGNNLISYLHSAYLTITLTYEGGATSVVDYDNMETAHNMLRGVLDRMENQNG